jgi:excisionase family DNA binding protein
MNARAPIPNRPPLTRDDVLDGRGVAELLHLPLSTVLEYARRGLLPGRKLGRRWIFLRDEVEAAVRGRSGEARRREQSARSLRRRARSVPRGS